MFNAFRAVQFAPATRRRRSRVQLLLASAALALALLVGPSSAQAQDEDMSEFVTPFRDNIEQARVIMDGIPRERSKRKKLRRKREALERLSRAYIILQRIPAKVQDAEDLGEDRRLMDSNLKSLGADSQIKKAKDNILAKGIQLYRAGKISESLGMFEELRLMDPSHRGVTFLVRHLNKKLDEEE